MKLPRFVILFAAILAATVAQAAAPLNFEPGDRICIVGNALAERMQHDGWLETLIQNRFREKNLSVRNLGFAADAVRIRQRSDGFGSPDDHLAFNKASVIFAFFGYNESFAGPAGIETFKKELTDFVRHTKNQKYNGRSGPQIVLFSSIAFEDIGNPHIPAPAERNPALEAYSKATEEVAQAADVLFVDLYSASAGLYKNRKEPLTINGIHLNEEGNKQFATVIDHALFGAPPAPVRWQSLEPMRKAIQEKNFYWFQRYRTTDGYNVYGGRSSLKFVADISNRDVMQREMEILAVLADNQDKQIWALASGRPKQVAASDVPPPIRVVSNKPGRGPDGQHPFLTGEAAISQMQLAEGLKASLFASEEMFPELANPVQMAFDPKGRLWVAVWPTYPHWEPQTPMNDKLLIFEDTDQDGKADNMIVFAGNLHNPTGFEFYNGGVLVAQAPDLVFLRDTDGDDKADVQERILHGLDSADTHHTANSFVLDPGGALYFQEGVFHRTQIESLYGPVRNRDACVWRFEPLSWKVERFIPYGFANPHGHVFNGWGQNFVTDGTGAETYQGTLFSGHLDESKRHAKPPRLYRQRTRPCSGTEILSSAHFPQENQGNLLVANVIGVLGILQYKIEEDGAGLKGTEVEPIVQSSDPNFRPSDIEIGPDGAIWFIDWHNPIIGHMQHHLRDPNRDKVHGRVYRITHTGRPLAKPASIAGASIPALIELLKSPEDRVRYRTKIELSARKSADVIAAVKKWAANLDPSDPAYEHHMLESLWVHQYHNVVDADLLKRMLRSPDHRARAAATRVLCAWRDRVPGALALLKVQVEDDNPQVRLEAVRTSSFFTGPEAAEAALAALQFPVDPYLQFVLDETMKQLDQFLK